jgi:hypothetical protein
MHHPRGVHQLNGKFAWSRGVRITKTSSSSSSTLHIHRPLPHMKPKLSYRRLLTTTTTDTDLAGLTMLDHPIQEQPEQKQIQDQRPPSSTNLCRATDIPHMNQEKRQRSRSRSRSQSRSQQVSRLHDDRQGLIQSLDLVPGDVFSDWFDSLGTTIEQQSGNYLLNYSSDDNDNDNDEDDTQDIKSSDKYHYHNNLSDEDDKSNMNSPVSFRRPLSNCLTSDFDSDSDPDPDSSPDSSPEQNSDDDDDDQSNNNRFIPRFLRANEKRYHQDGIDHHAGLYTPICQLKKFKDPMITMKNMTQLLSPNSEHFISSKHLHDCYEDIYMLVEIVETQLQEQDEELPSLIIVGDYSGRATLHVLPHQQRKFEAGMILKLQSVLVFYNEERHLQLTCHLIDPIQTLYRFKMIPIS